MALLGWEPTLASQQLVSSQGKVFEWDCSTLEWKLTLWPKSTVVILRVTENGGLALFGLPGISTKQPFADRVPECWHRTTSRVWKSHTLWHTQEKLGLEIHSLCTRTHCQEHLHCAQFSQHSATSEQHTVAQTHALQRGLLNLMGGRVTVKATERSQDF